MAHFQAHSSLKGTLAGWRRLSGEKSVWRRDGARMASLVDHLFITFFPTLPPIIYPLLYDIVVGHYPIVKPGRRQHSDATTVLHPRRRHGSLALYAATVRCRRASAAGRVRAAAPAEEEAEQARARQHGS